MVIGDVIPVSQIWPMVSTADDEKFNTKSNTKVTCATYSGLIFLNISLKPAY